MSSSDVSELDSMATELLKMAISQNNTLAEGRAYFYLSYYEPHLSDSVKNQRKDNLVKATRIAEESSNDTLLTYVYNQRGVWEIEDLGNVSTAQYWFARSLEHASKLDDRSFGIPAEMNLSETYRISNDTIGLKHIKDLFEYSLSNGDEPLRFAAAMSQALYYSAVAVDSADLRPYVSVMYPLRDVVPGCIDYVYARFFYHRGDYKNAEKFILKSNPENYSDMSLLYSRILSAMGRFDESNSWLDKTLELNPYLSPYMREDILRLKATNAHSLGDYPTAYMIMTELDLLVDSMTQRHDLDLSRRYKIEYDVMAKDREISKQKAKVRYMWSAALVALIFLSAAAFAINLWIRKRNKMYKDIVRQNREGLHNQETLIERIRIRDSQIEELMKQVQSQNTSESCASPRVNMVSEDKANDIYERIVLAADKDEVWRDATITREKFAELVGCNRTYFTDVIKKKAGMSYSQFMNSYRIREAIRILSDPENITPLNELAKDLGYLTIQGFYAAFKQATGISPARYRKTAKEI